MANTAECLVMLLRPGTATANDVAGHKHVRAAALRRLPLPLWSKVLVRIDGAAFSHELLAHLHQLTTTRRRVRFVTGWAIHKGDEQAIALLPEGVWTDAVRPDEDQEGVAQQATGPWNPAHPAASRENLSSTGRGQKGQPAGTIAEITQLTNRG